jgi:hypothetical protein
MVEYFISKGIDLSNPKCITCADGSRLPCPYFLVANNLAVLQTLRQAEKSYKNKLEIVGFVGQSKKLRNLVISNLMGSVAFYGKIEILSDVILAHKNCINFKAREQNKFEIYFVKEFTGFTPVMLSVAAGYDTDLGCLKLLIENGADINCQDFQGNTLIHIAAIYQNSEAL